MFLSRGVPISGCALIVATAFLAGCASYEPEPLNPLAILEKLEREPLEGLESRGREWAVEDLAALGIQRNPSLKALRARVGVAAAQLVEAGVLPDPTVSFDGMDVVAAEVTSGDPGTAEFVSGLGLSWTLPRPGEIDAREGVATASLDEARALVAAAEWELSRAIAMAYTELVGARKLLEQSERSVEAARRTSELYAAAREVREVTELDASLASFPLVTATIQRMALEEREAKARRHLNELLGLPPQYSLEIEAPPEDYFAPVPEDANPDAVVRTAILRRPDLRAAEARYFRAEEALRLELAERWPQVALGTGIALTLPLFSRFNEPAVARAAAEREVARREYEAAVHALRARVRDTLESYRLSERQVEEYERVLVPSVESARRLIGEAIEARALGGLSQFAAMREVLEAEATFLESRIDLAKRRVDLESLTGLLWRDPKRGGYSE
jgi:outer membrane protein TolC